MKNTFKVTGLLLLLVGLSSIDWLLGFTTVMILVLVHMLNLLFDAEDRAIAEIEQRQMEIDKKLEEINWMKRDYRIGKFMEEN